MSRLSKNIEAYYKRIEVRRHIGNGKHRYHHLRKIGCGGCIHYQPGYYTCRKHWTNPDIYQFRHPGKLCFDACKVLQLSLNL